MLLECQRASSGGSAEPCQLHSPPNHPGDKSAASIARSGWPRSRWKNAFGIDPVRRAFCFTASSNRAFRTTDKAQLGRERTANQGEGATAIEHGVNICAADSGGNDHCIALRQFEWLPPKLTVDPGPGRIARPRKGPAAR
jgi:hypothetical protein